MNGTIMRDTYKMTTRLLTRKVDGKEGKVLTSLEAPSRYPSGAVSELYRPRREIKLDYCEAKQGMLDSSAGAGTSGVMGSTADI